MLNMCPKCGNGHWNKEVTEDKTHIICQECGHQWKFQSLPLFILTGCSGVGKTTTARELLQRDTPFFVMDSDYLFNLLPHDTDEDYKNLAEQMMFLSINLMQGGKPFLWAKAGALEFFDECYHRRFFTDIHYLALVCSSDALETRMREGRHITDPNWIEGSINHNRWFIEDGMMFDKRIDTYDITGKTVTEIADYVTQWVEDRIN